MFISEIGNSAFQDENGDILVIAYHMNNKYALFQRALNGGFVAWSRSASAQRHGNPYSEFDTQKFMESWGTHFPLPLQKPSAVSSLAPCVRPLGMEPMMDPYAIAISEARDNQ